MTLPPGAVPGHNGNGYLLPQQPGQPNTNYKRTNVGKWRRKEVRTLLVDMLGETGISKLREMMEGRAKVLIGFNNHEELAERFHELYERNLDPDADRVPVWDELPQARKDLLIQTMRDLTGGKLSMREIAVKVGVSAQQFALSHAAQYGLGFQNANVDEEGDAVQSVVVMPPLDIHHATQRQQSRLRAEAHMIEDADYEYIYENLDTGVHDEIDVAPKPIREEETVNPALVAIIKSRRKKK